MTVKGGTTQACAACKYRRCKCSSQCLLAPYFPSTDPARFQSARRLFGVANMITLLKGLETQEERDEAMKSVVYESEMRQRFPVHGCCGVIHELHFQLVQSVKELQCVEEQLAAYKEESQLQHQQQQQQQQQQQILPHGCDYGPSELDLEASFVDHNALVFQGDGTSFDDVGGPEDYATSERKLKSVTFNI